MSSPFDHLRNNPFLTNNEPTKEGQENWGRWEKENTGTHEPQKSYETYDAYINRINQN